MATAEARVVPAATVPSKRFFTDIAGLRGVAVLLVVLFHARIPGLGGGFVGVDVFFVISGFLITGLLIREYEKTGTLSFKGFYARRCRRIIPAAALVIVVSLIGAVLTMPLLRVFKQSLDLLAAAANLANWHFLAQNADYLAGSIDGSLATHFWSLAIEEQLYFVWPLTVFAAAALVSRTVLRKVIGVRVSIGVVVGALTVGSLIWAIQLTPVDPATAYMATYTRVWQFGFGALLAVIEPLLLMVCLRVPVVARVVGGVLGWAGLAGVIAAAVLIDAHTPYPGTAALLPTAAAVAIIASGQLNPVGEKPGPSSFWFVGGLLSIAPMRFLGRVSYAWYLWHWPALVLFETVAGTTSWPALLAVSAVSLAIATASTLWFEEPIIGNRTLRANRSASISVGLTGLVVGLAVTMTVGVVTVKIASRDTVANAALNYQSVFGRESAETSGPVVPNPFQAYDDRPEPNECLLPVGELHPVRECTFGPVDGIPVVLFGDSHAEQWSEAIRTIGDAHGWRIHQFTKAACPAQNLRPVPGRGDPFNKEDCLQWRADSLRAITALDPKIVIVSSLSTYAPEYETAESAWNDTLATLRATGADLVYIADTPYPGFQVADCMSGALDDWSRCDFELDNVPRHEPILTEQARGRDTDILTVDVNDLLCDGNRCVPARNKILFYRDDSHLTATAARVLEPALTKELDAQRFDYNAR
ncbi:acyltransferase [Gordonia desulfuricans]|uniref:Acyltransferase n=1 Tax=Gordonia desulfuricans TaxID=89051 RepID=A0A7K3LNT4_9ACTN|nr:acyltransferase family protein [Gordonia desulfuricans]NDK89883.1 acyltransferase [Gordonia desulfuricans]